MAHGRLDRDELEAALSVRQELGPSYEPAIVEALAERLESVVEARVAQRIDADQRALRAEKADRRHAISLAVTSLILGIPITAISGALTDLPGVIAAWTGIVGVNVAHALSARRRRA